MHCARTNGRPPLDFVDLFLCFTIVGTLRYSVGRLDIAQNCAADRLSERVTVGILAVLVLAYKLHIVMM